MCVKETVRRRSLTTVCRPRWQEREKDMEIRKSMENGTLTIELEGRLDTMTAPDLENEIRSSADGVEKIILDFAGLAYISSAGLRVLLSTQKKMNASGGSLVIRKPNDVVSEVCEATGFSDILEIEA